jgi:acetylornithine/succinyldiaminopimelate/putrescine aminotransferase
MHAYITGLKKINNPHVKDVRGVGLLCGMQLDVPAGNRQMQTLTDDWRAMHL